MLLIIESCGVFPSTYRELFLRVDTTGMAVYSCGECARARRARGRDTGEWPMSTQETPDPEWIDLYQAADQLGVSQATMWNLLKRHEIDRYRMPGRRRTMIKRSDFDRLRQPIKLDAPQRGRPRGGSQAIKRAAGVSRPPVGSTVV